MALGYLATTLASCANDPHTNERRRSDDAVPSDGDSIASKKQPHHLLFEKKKKKNRSLGIVIGTVWFDVDQWGTPFVLFSFLTAASTLASFLIFPHFFFQENGHENPAPLCRGL